MPTQVLEICFRNLEQKYSERLGKPLLDSLTEGAEQRCPVWKYVQSTDLTSVVEAADNGAAGLLFDPEIGLLCYLLPFSGTSELRQQVSRALKLRSELSADHSYAGETVTDCDEFGAWRVAAVWLVVGEAVREKWIEQITEIRRETAFSEEISFDAIFLTENHFEEDIEHYGFPRLLLTTREVLKKNRPDEITRWMSANDLVIDAVKDFPKTFSTDEQRECATEIAHAARAFRSKASGVPASPEAPIHLESLHVTDFRNLRDVDLHFGVQPVSAHVVHGPNGTGKTSLCEAMSIALFGSSQRYKAFADRDREKDLGVNNRTTAYVEQYLTPIETSDAEPKISLNGSTLLPLRLVNPDEISDADLAMSGTILMQDASREFTRLSSHELGSRVLRGYSELADELEELTESRYARANAARQEFLRSLNLSAQITRLDTAFSRIATRTIDHSGPTLPRHTLAWLEEIRSIPLAQATNLHNRWNDWGDTNKREELCAEISRTNSRSDIVTHLRRWLDQYEELVRDTEQFLQTIGAMVANSTLDLQTAFDRLKNWGAWLERPKKAAATANRKRQETALSKQLKELQAEEKKVIEQGQQGNARLDHLAHTKLFLDQGWATSHPNECPTCGKQQEVAGGIRKVIESLEAELTRQRDLLREQFSRAKSQLDEAQKKLEESGSSQPPLTVNEQVEIGAAVAWLLPEGSKITQYVSERSQRGQLLDLIQAVRKTPSAPPVIDAEAESNRLADLIDAAFAQARAIFDAPDNWKPIKDALTSTLARIVREHLPNTLVRLWCELTMSLTTAPWLLPGRPCIDVTTRRGEQRSTIQIENRLARYILNQSEIQTLGLAWFFARYLTHGRFSHSCIILDDPAQELDQTSFRDLCRLWETWIRLHRVYERPLKFVVMLNQESRALDAARATGGVLAILGWSREQEDSIRSVSVIPQDYCTPKPIYLFEAKIAS